MTALPMTSDALKQARRNIKLQFPALTSAHLTEALAYGLGYRTNASMLPELDRRPANDPDYAYLDEAAFGLRATQLAGTPIDGGDLAFVNLEACGGIETYSPGAEQIDLTGSVRKRAWRNAMVMAINAGIEQRLFSIRPGDCRWDGWKPGHGPSEGATFRFSFGEIPAIGYVHDAGFDELAVHVALWPTAEGEGFVGAFNAGRLAGEVFATGWLERRRGAWLQVGNDVGEGWTFSGGREVTRTVAELNIRPMGYAAAGSFMM